MSASAPAVPAALAGKVPPLALPVGSVRALITLATLGTVWFHQFQHLAIPPVLADTLLLVLGYYFGTRNAASTAGTAPAADALAAAPAADREANRKDPLFLPRGMIRILIVVGFAAIGMKLFNDGKIDPGNPPPEYALLGGFLGASATRGGFARLGRMLAVKIVNFVGHVLAGATLFVVLAYCAATIAGLTDYLTAETSAIFAGIVGFYMGKR